MSEVKIFVPSFCEEEPRFTELSFPDKDPELKNVRVVAVCHEKDAWKWISRSVASVFSLVDRVLIVDDGSSEVTLQLLEYLKSFLGDRFHWEIYHREGPFQEQNIRTYCFHRAVEKFGWPDWFLYFDGDEEYSVPLVERLKKEFLKPREEISYGSIWTGWLHLVSQSFKSQYQGPLDISSRKFQVLNRRLGRIIRIWNTFSLKKKDLSELVFSSLVGRKNYVFHTSPVPDVLTGLDTGSLNLTSSRFLHLLEPVLHYGFYDLSELVRKRKYHFEDMKNTYRPDSSLLQDKELVCLAPTDEEIRFWSERYDFLRAVRDWKASGKELELRANWSVREDFSDSLLVMPGIFPLVWHRSSKMIRNRPHLNFILEEEFLNNPWCSRVTFPRRILEFPSLEEVINKYRNQGVQVDFS